MSDALDRIQILESEWIRQFTARYLEYGEGAADELGLAGQWGDLHRKVNKLKRQLWLGDDRVPTRESPREILLDIIGHAFLAIDMIDRSMTGGRKMVEDEIDPNDHPSMECSRSIAHGRHIWHSGEYGMKPKACEGIGHPDR